MASTVLGIHGSGIHASRPAANTVPDGSLYSCSTHNLIYVSSYGGNSWSTWASLTGTGLSDPMTTRGDIIVRNSSNTTDRLALGGTGTFLGKSGSDVAYILPPGTELDYVEKTSATSVTATAEASADTVVTGSAVTYDGSTPIIVEFFASSARPDNTAAARTLSIYLYDGASSIGRMWLSSTPAASTDNKGILARRKLTPSAAAHTYSIRAAVSAGTGNVGGGAGGSGADMPTYVRVTKA